MSLRAFTFAAAVALLAATVAHAAPPNEDGEEMTVRQFWKDCGTVPSESCKSEVNLIATNYGCPAQKDLDKGIALKQLKAYTMRHHDWRDMAYSDIFNEAAPVLWPCQ